MKIIMPFSNRKVRLNLKSHSKIYTCLRGPDDGAYFAKSLGTAVIRGLILHWNYGDTSNLAEQKRLLRNYFFRHPNIYASRLVEAPFHYKSHLHEGFELLKNLCHANEPKDLTYFKIYTAMWYNAYLKENDDVKCSLGDLMYFLEEYVEDEDQTAI